ncbi:MAG: hypothetical protein EKK53_16065 [Burkholderiales bacterium]|nr:MAG: hypothetical protein EKK53_16065 [Burkholderiales bacterium]
MNADRADRHAHALHHPLLEEVSRHQPELRGYPVAPLLDDFLRADDLGRLHAYQLADHCLASWIAQLDRPVERVLDGLPDVFDKIESRQRGARDALARIHAALMQARDAQTLPR